MRTSNKSFNELSNPRRYSRKSISRSRSRSRSNTPTRRTFDREQNTDIRKRIKLKNGDSNYKDPLDSVVKEKFVWKKKLEDMEMRGVNRQELEEQEREKQLRIALEIEKVQKRKMEQEEKQAEAGRQRGIKQDINDEESYEKWLEKEEKFHIEQAKLRSEIRIQQGREQPVDYLVKILLIHRGHFDYDPVQEREIRKPYVLLARLTQEELTQLQTDIEEKAKIEINDYYKQFWDKIKILVEDRQITINNARVPGRKHRGSILGTEFENEVNEMIGDRSYAQLIELEKEIHQTLDCPSDFKIDVEYWENVLKKLKVQKAKAFLEEMGNRFLDEYLIKNPNPKKSGVSVTLNTGDLSPRLVDYQRSFQKLIITAAEDIEALNQERGNRLVEELQKVFKDRKPEEKAEDNNEMNIEEEEDDEEQDGKEEQEFDEVALDEEQNYEWAKKYKPRKPQYFNRVKVGYEWNKYNQTHYDQDNPPPKIVLGYKFNIFYPDLIDAYLAPEFHLEATDNPDFCIIKFHAGPPYEDIAFKILNKEWDFSDKQGFKCIFEGNILYLYFNFRKPRYRR